MKPDVVLHLQHNWPLVVIAVGLSLFVPAVLATGVFPTNQGKVVRSRDPVGYWRWVRRFVVLLIASFAVLFGSYFLTAK